MNKKNTIVFGLLGIAAVAVLGLFLSIADEEDNAVSFDVPWTGSEDPEDPYHGFVEEGGGLIAQFKAEAAAKTGLQRKA